MGKEVEDSRMKWNVFSLKAVKEALKPKFVLEKVRYVTDDEEYGEGESTRLVFRNVEEMPKVRTISAIPQTISFHHHWNSLAKHTFLTKATHTSGW